MNEQDIDKIFRDNLAHSEESITDADWKQFETLAGSKKSFKWAYLISGLLLLGTVGYFTASTLLSSNESTVTSSIQKSETKTADQNQNKSDNANNAVSNVSNDKSEIENNKLTNKENEIDPQITTESSEFNNNNSNTPIGTTSLRFSKSETEGFGNMKTNDSTKDEDTNTASFDSEKSTTNENQNKPAGNKALAAIPALIAAENGYSTSSSTSSLSQKASTKSQRAQEGQRNFSDYSPSIATMEFDPEKIDEIGLSEIAISFELANLNEDASKSEMPNASKFTLDAFGQFELNNELGSIPSIGLMANWNQNKWKMSLGFSIAKTGTLNWNQERQDVIYGFDKYNTESTLRTKNFTYLSMPIQVSRLIGGRSGAFIGLTPAIIVNASQAFTTTENGVSESSGYLFETGAPDFMLFLSAGYQFYIHEDFRLDFGINYAPQKWEATSKNPLGGFIRLNYTIR